MKSNGATGRDAPPYVGFQTLQNFLEALRQGIPPRGIDRTMMPTLGGTVQKQLLHALHYLGLTSESGVPQEALKRLVAADGIERRQLWRQTLENAYPFLSGEEALDFDLSIATSGQLREKFTALGIQGETARKAEAFFLRAADEAGMTVSPYIPKRISKPRRALGQLGKSRNGHKPRKRSTPEELPTPSQILAVGTDEERISRAPAIGQGAFAWEELSAALRPLGAGYLSIEGSLRQLPMSRKWTEQHRDRWFRAFTAALDLIIEVIETRNDHPKGTEGEVDRINSVFREKEV